MKGSFDIGAEYYVKYANWNTYIANNEFSFEIYNGIPVLYLLQQLSKDESYNTLPIINLYARHEAFHKINNNLGTNYFAKKNLLCAIDLSELKESDSDYCYEYYFGKEIVQTLKENSHFDVWTHKFTLKENSNIDVWTKNLC